MDIVVKIAEMIAVENGRAFFVGGFVRDRILGVESSDIDIECFGVSYDTLFAILSEFGTVFTVGRAFGILKIAGYPHLDFAMPRTEKKTGDKHQDFEVALDPHLSYIDAASRRDFTCNALMEDVLTGEVLDFFGGVADLERLELRHISDETFVEDALRGLRACQFASRFNFRIAAETCVLIKGLRYVHLSGERIVTEIAKGLFKSKQPSVFIGYMLELGIFEQIHPDFVRFVSSSGERFSFCLEAIDALVATTVYEESEVLAMLCFLSPRPKVLLKRLTYVLRLRKSTLALISGFVGISSAQRLSDCRRILFVIPDVMRFLELVRYFDSSHALVLGQSFSDFSDFFMVALRNNSSSTPLVQGRDLIAMGLVPSDLFVVILNVAKELEIAGCYKEEILALISRKYVVGCF